MATWSGSRSAPPSSPRQAEEGLPGAFLALLEGGSLSERQRRQTSGARLPVTTVPPRAPLLPPPPVQASKKYSGALDTAALGTAAFADSLAAFCGEADEESSLIGGPMLLKFVSTFREVRAGAAHGAGRSGSHAVYAASPGSCLSGRVAPRCCCPAALLTPCLPPPRHRDALACSWRHSRTCCARRRR